MVVCEVHRPAKCVKVPQKCLVWETLIQTSIVHLCHRSECQRGGVSCLPTNPAQSHIRVKCALPFQSLCWVMLRAISFPLSLDLRNSKGGLCALSSGPVVGMNSGGHSGEDYLSPSLISILSCLSDWLSCLVEWVR